jgi:hypothetical protein
MITRYITLQQRIRQEMADIELCVSIINKHWVIVDETDADKTAYVYSVAFNLHSFYAGIERIFELIANEIDGGVVSGESWHNNVLRQMAVDLPGVRPAVLTAETAEFLAEYLRFRHLIRNIYVFRLDVTRMAHLAQEIDVVWTKLQQEINHFIDYLQALSRADEVE